MRGERGGEVLVHEGFRYTWHRMRQDCFLWRCWRRPRCTVNISTNIFDRNIENPDIMVIQVIGDHTHPPDTDIVERARLRNEMQAEALQDPHASE